MIMSGHGNTLCIIGPLWGESTGHQWIFLLKKQYYSTLMFSLSWAWTNCWRLKQNTEIVSMSRHHHGSTSFTWWRHQMETFSALLALCAGNSPVTGEFPAQRPVTWSFDVFFDLRLNKWFSKQSWGWWFETSSHSLWCHCNEKTVFNVFRSPLSSFCAEKPTYPWHCWQKPEMKTDVPTCNFIIMHMCYTLPDSKVHGANMGPIWGHRTQVGPMLAPWTLLSGLCSLRSMSIFSKILTIGTP